ncbi:MAG TPA: hypothetical protein VGX48_07380 [Pyrinomonadaceae bacterium]|jgi:hypothetical protein|nr:hypothetical protein [Pyrinomonadaceae bacterium]
MRFSLKVAALALFVVSGAGAVFAQGSEAPLTNSAVVKLVRAGFSEKTVIAIIRSRPSRFELSAEKLIELKKGGVGERVILAMLARNEAAVVENDSLDDDAFFGDGLSGKGSPSGQPSNPGETNIFGSSGGSHGRNRTRGGNGGVDTDTQTTGSATVRILRPPAEAGGAPAKLERTPTLTNDSVVELVEAGFTEGTIVRRIEQSPVEFDLSPTKLAELRKRRVTETVIAAMRAAMGEDAQQPARPEK